MVEKKYPKEQLRVFSNGTVCEMNNYISMSRYGTSKKSGIKLKQDKGIANEYKYIYDVLKGKRKNDSIEDALKAQRMILQVLDSTEPILTM